VKKARVLVDDRCTALLSLSSLFGG